MKLFSKVLCILSVLVLCVPFFCLSVSAAESSDNVILPPYYGIETFAPNEDGSGFKMKAEDIDSNGLPLFYQKNYIDTDVTEGEKKSLYGEEISGKTFLKPPYYVSGTNAINARDEYVMFTKSLYNAVKKNNMVMNTTDEYYYFTFFYEYSYVDPATQGSGDYTCTDFRRRYCVTYLSTTPISFKTSSNGFILNGSEDYVGETNFEIFKGTYDDEPLNWTYSAMNNNYSSLSKIYFDSNLIFNKSLDTSTFSYEYISKCYTNCNIDTSMFDSDENLVKGLSSLNKTLKKILT